MHTKPNGLGCVPRAVVVCQGDEQRLGFKPADLDGSLYHSSCCDLWCDECTHDIGDSCTAVRSKCELRLK